MCIYVYVVVVVVGRGECLPASVTIPLHKNKNSLPLFKERGIGTAPNVILLDIWVFGFLT